MNNNDVAELTTILICREVLAASTLEPGARVALDLLDKTVLAPRIAALTQSTPESTPEPMAVKRTLSLSESPDLVKIGRHPPSNTVVFDHPSVARFHAVIERDHDCHRVIETSPGPTFVNGIRVDRNAIVQAGDVLRFGEVSELRLEP